MEKVSIITAAYNAEQFVAQTIDSVLKQTFEDWHLYIVNDGSTDGTAVALQQYSDHPKITCIEQTNGGQASAKNCGARHACGEFIAFLDADDTWEPGKLQLQVADLKSTQAAVSYSDYQIMDETGRICDSQPGETNRPSGMVLPDLLLSNFVPFSSSVVRRSVFEEAGGFDEKLSMGIDWDLWLRISRYHEFKYMDRKLLNYRVWAGQMSTNLVGRYEGAFRILEAFVAENSNLLDRRMIGLAYADTYAHRAIAKRFHSSDFIGAVLDCLRALKHAPHYGYAWRTLVKVLINRPTKT